MRQGFAEIMHYNQAFSDVQYKLDTTKWSDHVLLEIYKKGLKVSLYSQLAGLSRSEKWDLSDWMGYAINIEKGAHNVKYRDRTYQPTYEAHKTSIVDYVPMEVDKRSFIRKKCEKSRRGKSKSFKNTKASSSSKCFLCKQSSHFARDCKSGKVYNKEFENKSFNQNRFKRSMIKEEIVEDDQINELIKDFRKSLRLNRQIDKDEKV